jgi:hypoxanthine phosphoribosyltransferase
MTTVQVLLTEAQIRARVNELGAELRRQVGPEATIHLVGALKGAFVFMADLMRATPGPITCDFAGVSSYGSGTISSGRVELYKSGASVTGRHVVIVEDIVDTGLTLAALHQTLAGQAPASLRTVCLLNKPSRRRTPVLIELVGFTIEDRFVVGYGLDADERFRELPYIAVLDGGA